MRFKDCVFHFSLLCGEADLAILERTHTAAHRLLASVQILQQLGDHGQRASQHEERLQNMELLMGVGHLYFAIHAERRVVFDLQGRGPDGFLIGLESVKVLGFEFHVPFLPSTVNLTGLAASEYTSCQLESSLGY